MPGPVSKITKDTITAKGASGLTCDLKCDYKTLLESKSKIWFWTGCDKKHKFFERLSCEWSIAPLVNTRLKEDISGLLDKSNRIAVICITSFFDDGSDFVFFVKGYKNLANFLKLTFSGRAYDDPCFATPLQVFSFKKLMESPGLDCLAFECVSKTETKGLRWLYLYKSAINAWEKLEFDLRKHDVIKERLSHSGPMMEELSDTEEDTTSDTTDEDREEDEEEMEKEKEKEGKEGEKDDDDEDDDDDDDDDDDEEEDEDAD